MQPVQVSAENGIMTLQYSCVPCQWVLTAVQRGQEDKENPTNFGNNFSEHFKHILKSIVG